MEYKAAEVVRTELKVIATTSIHLFPRAFSEIILISFKAERANIYHREPQSGVSTKLPLRTNRQSADALNIALRIFIEP